MLHLLLEYGVDIKSDLKGSGNPLHLASFIGSILIVRKLIEKGADINDSCAPLGSALLAALRGNNKAVVELLLRRGINVNYILTQYGSALHCVCLKNKRSMVEILFLYDADVNARGGCYSSVFSAVIAKTQIYVESQLEDLEIASILFKHNTFLVQESDWLAAMSGIGSAGVQDLIEMLLGFDKTFQETESTLVTALGKISDFWSEHSIKGTKVLRALLQRDRLVGVTKALIEATQDSSTIEVLLEHRPVRQITTEMIISPSQKDDWGRELMQVLLDHNKCIPITEGILLASLASSVRYPFMLRRRRSK